MQLHSDDTKRLNPDEAHAMVILRGMLTSLALALATPVFADSVHVETVHFSPGTSGATIHGRLQGGDTVAYKVGVRSGQKMSVQLDSRNKSLYFNVNRPGSGTALYNSSIAGNGASMAIPADGSYTVQVYLMRNAARRNEAADYTLTLYVE